MLEPLRICACALLAVIAPPSALDAGEHRQPEAQTQPATRPAGEVVRVLRSVPMEGGRSERDVNNPNTVMPHPAYAAWRAWGVGTRAIVRLDEVDAQGRTFPRERYVLRLASIDDRGARVIQQRVEPDGSLGEPMEQFFPAQCPRMAVVMLRRSEQMVYWRRYDARVAFEKPQAKASPADTPPDEPPRRSRRKSRGQAVAPDPREALPPEFDCAILDVAHLDLEDDPAAPADPAAAAAGTAVYVYRSYHSVDAPGWEVILEVYRGRLDEDGVPQELELLSRRRLERILRPNEPDLTPEELRAGLPIGG